MIASVNDARARNGVAMKFGCLFLLTVMSVYTLSVYATRFQQTYLAEGRAVTVEQKPPNLRASSSPPALQNPPDPMEEACAALFAQGDIMPRETGSQNGTQVEEWDKFGCDDLFCEKNITDECQWTLFGTTLLTQEAAQHCSNMEIVEKFLPDLYWKDYRVSDLFRGWGSDIDGKDIDKYPGSIMYDYKQRTIQKNGNFTPGRRGVLGGVIKKHARGTEDIPADTIAVHLRLGDVIELTPDPVEKLLQRKCYYHVQHPDYEDFHPAGPMQFPDVPRLTGDWNNYVKQLSFYTQIDWTQYKNVVLVGAAHLPKKWAQSLPVPNMPVKSCEYTYALKAYLERLGKNVTLRLGNTPDEDLIYFSKVKAMVQGGGGYSWLLADITQMFEGNIVK